MAVVLGYVGVMRESRILLFLVRISGGLEIMLFITFQYFTLLPLIWALQIFTFILLPAFKNILDYLASWIANKSLENYKGESEEENLISFSLNHIMGTVSFPTNMRFYLSRFSSLVVESPTLQIFHIHKHFN